MSPYAILNSHAKSHGYQTVKEMTKEHGNVKYIGFDSKKMRKNLEKLSQIHESSYNNIDSALLKMRNKY